MKVTLWQKTYQLKKPNPLIGVDQLMQLDEKGFNRLKKDIGEGNGNQEDTLSLFEEVALVLESPEIERDDNDKIQRNQQGQAQAKPFDIKSQRIVNRLLDQIEDKTNGKKKPKSVTVEAKPDDVVYMCDRMMAHFNEYPRIRKGITEAYDHFVDLKAEADKEKSKKDTE